MGENQYWVFAAALQGDGTLSLKGAIPHHTLHVELGCSLSVDDVNRQSDGVNRLTYRFVLANRIFVFLQHGTLSSPCGACSTRKAFSLQAQRNQTVTVSISATSHPPPCKNPPAHPPPSAGPLAMVGVVRAGPCSLFCAGPFNKSALLLFCFTLRGGQKCVCGGGGLEVRI